MGQTSPFEKAGLGPNKSGSDSPKKRSSVVKRHPGESDLLKGRVQKFQCCNADSGSDSLQIQVLFGHRPIQIQTPSESLTLFIFRFCSGSDSVGSDILGATWLSLAHPWELSASLGKS